MQANPKAPINQQPEQMMGRVQELERNGAALMLVRATSGDSSGGQMVTLNVGVEFGETDNDIPPLEPGLTERLMRLKGTLNWGCGEGYFTAEVDVHNGSQFSVAASFLNFSVVFEPPPPAPAPDNRFFRAKIGAGIVWGTRPSHGPVTRTLEKRIVPEASFTTYRIPSFAYAALFFSQSSPFYDAAAAAVTLLFHAGPLPTDDLSLALAPAQVPALTARGGISFPESARFVTVQNIAFGSPLPIRPTFLLDL